MIIHSIVPHELIFQNGGEEESQPIEMLYLGETVVAQKNGDNNYVICRVISTSPHVYLNPQLQPGMQIKKENWQ